ncbi:uncharacterized protein METZ01_LOCUS185188, partial [marine metagenome]
MIYRYQAGMVSWSSELATITATDASPV